MARIKGKTEVGVPQINRLSVQNFFKERAAKAQHLGPMQAVIYQDKNPDLARERDAAEKAKLLPLLGLSGRESVLDVGCGTGRWAEEIIPRSAVYWGADFSPELIEIASRRFELKVPQVRFFCLPAEKIAFAELKRRFDVILSLGLFIYLNDDDLVQALRGYASVADAKCKLLLREPVGLLDRLTILEHFSEDMEQTYNAIYRTEKELRDLMDAELVPAGFRMTGSGDVYESPLNNRADTRQKWFLLEKP